MSRSTIHSFEDLPVTLCAPHVAAALGISKSCAYTLMHRGDFPTIRIGKRMIVSKAKFWHGSKAKMRKRFLLYDP